ncbi:MAG: Vps62-related protein [Bacteroidota bacterium]
MGITLVIPMTFTTLAFGQQVETNDLFVGFTSKFKLNWQDKGSGVSTDSSYWKPVPPSGYSLIGDYAQNSYNDPNGNAVILVLKAKQRNALATPSDFVLVWKDTGSGAKLDGSMWNMVCPNGYVSLGSVSQAGYSKPDVNSYRCVRANLAPTGTVGDLVWSDKGTGAKTDFSAWGIKASTAQSGYAHLSAGSFIAQPNHAAPLNANTLLVPVTPTQAAPSPRKPVLSGYGKPSDFGEDIVSYTTYLPWFAVKDPGLTDAQKIVQSPVYSLVRTSQYRLIDHIDNQNGNADQSRSFDVTVGTTQAEEKNFSESTGISLTVGYTPPGDTGGVNASVTLSKETTTGWTRSKEINKETSVGTPLNVPKGTAGAVYEVISTFTLRRQNQQQVGQPISGGTGSSVYFASFPAPSK